MQESLKYPHDGPDKTGRDEVRGLEASWKLAAASGRCHERPERRALKMPMGH
jgi:hypothetical protein